MVIYIKKSPVNIRKIIRETIENIIDKQDTAEKFDQDIVYLKGFSLNKKEEKGNSTIWVFDHKEKDYVLRFYIQKHKNNETWDAKVFIYWKQPSKEFTNSKGKDVELKFGPFYSYEEMVQELNRKLANNPNISPNNFLDNDNIQMKKDLIEMLKVMMKYGDKIEAVQDEHFKDLKKLYRDVLKIKSMEELESKIEKEAPVEEDKQTLLLVIQKIYQLDFYLKMEHLKSLF